MEVGEGLGVVEGVGGPEACPPTSAPVAAAATAAGAPLTGWRVKLYKLETDETGAWQDQGTGLACCRPHPEGPALLVMGEPVVGAEGTAYPPNLLECKIKADDVYERQGESIIMWREPGDAGDEFATYVDYALSFQDSEGCLALWEEIIAVQRQYLTLQEYGQLPSLSSYAMSSSSSSSSLRNSKADCWTGTGMGMGMGSGYGSNNIYNGNGANPTLPVISEATLSEIRERFMSTLTSSQKDGYAGLVLEKDGDFLKRLLTLFSDLEDLEDTENLGKIAEILRSLMLLNDPHVLELLVSDNLFLSVAGAMEFDPLLKSKADFRFYLSDTVKRRDVKGAEVTHPDQIAAIQRLFKLRFLRDFLARPCLEEVGSGNIENSINVASIEVCTRLFADIPLMASLLRVINPALEFNDDIFLRQSPSITVSPTTELTVIESQSPPPAPTQPASLQQQQQSQSQVDAPNRLDGLKFLRELFHLSRSLSYERRNDLYTRFCAGEGYRQAGLKRQFFAMCHQVLAHPDSQPEECALVAEMLVCFSTICPNIVRLIILQGPVPSFPKSSSGDAGSTTTIAAHTSAPPPSSSSSFHQNSQCLLWVLVQRIAMDTDTSVIDKIGDILRVLLDPERFERQEKDSFLGVFYDHYIYWLLLPFGEEFETDKSLPFGENWPSTSERTQDRCALSASRRTALDLLCVCVSGHSYRMKYFVMRNSVINLVLRLMTSTKHRHLQLSAIKFVRAIVATKDEFYYRHLVKHDFMRPILEALKSGKDGLFTSTILELIHYIIEEGIKTLITNMVERYSDCFAAPICAEIFERLKGKYEQGRAAEIDKESRNSMRQQRQQERDNEDAYFFEDDSSSSAAPAKINRSEASTSSVDVNPLAYLASAYEDDDYKLDGVVPTDEEISQTGNDDSSHQNSDPPLPPLKPKYEIDEIPDTFLRVRSSEGAAGRLSMAKNDIGSESKSINSVSFTIKKRKFA